MKEWFKSLKHSLKCADCNISGYPHSWILDFHHLDSSEKFSIVSKMVHDGYGKEKILAEIEKCVVLCSNCHRIRHIEDVETNTRLKSKK